ncbi:HpcH/HpaI aldolase/citrate lyase family protein [Microvirga massiliensis]|uniref:HpcH/HpaI aldolase/citrate lyase family protein n=1 Tax=Microvirga massiliensis TaxID=1033741 RepID=UPI00062B8E1B|nr:CoA ester lyase [Microvirga massiliensis]
MALPLTYLFVPGNRPDRFDKALGSGADAVILDLEDAVDPAAKDDARAMIRAWLDAAPRDGRVLVRINDGGTPWFTDDLSLLRHAGISGVVLPKAEEAAQIARVAGVLAPGGVVVPLIETARGLRAVDAIAAAERVQRLAFGTLDFAVDLDLSGDERGLGPPAMAIAVASRCAGRAGPVAGVTPEIGDEAALARDLAWARAFGFTAKLCIHPRQVDAVRRALAPSDQELDWARRVLAAAGSAAGAVQVDGRMVDRPVLLKAQSILDRAPN